MNDIFNFINEIKEKENIKITSFAERKNGKFTDYEYFTIEKENIFFYIQYNNWRGYEVTAYKKIDFNHKQQITYPRSFDNNNELLKIIDEIIEINKERKLSPLSSTHEQIIYYELLTYYNFNGKYQTLEKHLQDIAGTREKEIFKNIDFVEMKQNDGVYLVLEFYSKTGQAFAINANNINRLIIS